MDNFHVWMDPAGRPSLSPSSSGDYRRVTTTLVDITCLATLSSGFYRIFTWIAIGIYTSPVHWAL